MHRVHYMLCARQKLTYILDTYSKLSDDRAARLLISGTFFLSSHPYFKQNVYQILQDFLTNTLNHTIFGWVIHITA